MSMTSIKPPGGAQILPMGPQAVTAARGCGMVGTASTRMWMTEAARLRGEPRRFVVSERAPAFPVHHACLGATSITKTPTAAVRQQLAVLTAAMYWISQKLKLNTTATGSLTHNAPGPTRDCTLRVQHLGGRMRQKGSF